MTQYTLEQNSTLRLMLALHKLQTTGHNTDLISIVRATRSGDTAATVITLHVLHDIGLVRPRPREEEKLGHPNQYALTEQGQCIITEDGYLMPLVCRNAACVLSPEDVMDETNCTYEQAVSWMQCHAGHVMSGECVMDSFWVGLRHALEEWPIKQEESERTS